jgi:hypothetical protein
MTTFTDQEPVKTSIVKTAPEPDTIEPKHDGLTTSVEKENKLIPVPEQIKAEPQKRSFLSRFFLPNG